MRGRAMLLAESSDQRLFNSFTRAERAVFRRQRPQRGGERLGFTQEFIAARAGISVRQSIPSRGLIEPGISREIVNDFLELNAIHKSAFIASCRRLRLSIRGIEARSTFPLKESERDAAASAPCPPRTQEPVQLLRNSSPASRTAPPLRGNGAAGSILHPAPSQ